ncbi:MAG TPA: hypothetical protein VGX97_05310 [bacterium]|nr:hypothetical protein [bacterium]
MRSQRGVAVLVSLLLAILPAAAGRTPAAAGTWSGSTADDGIGHSISVEGSSTETHNPDGTTTSTSQSTTSIKDNETGQVVTVITRSRTITKTAPPRPKTVRAASVDETTTYTTGGAYSVAHDEQAVWPVAGGRTQSSREHLTQQYGPDAGGHAVLKGQRKVVIQSDGSKRTTVRQVWNPQTNQWQTGDQLATPLQTSKAPQVYLPERVTANCPAGGTVQTEPQAVPAGTVVATTAKGQTYSFLVEPNGRFTLPLDLMLPGALKLSIKDQLGLSIADRTLQVTPAPAAVTGPSAITQAPPVVLGGGIGRLSLQGPCPFDPLLDPDLYMGLKDSLGTSRYAYRMRMLAWSSGDITVRVPADIMPGRGAFMLQNGLGRWTPPKPTNPVRLGLAWDYDLKFGRPFDMKVDFTGLAKEYAQNPFTATVTPWGTATFTPGVSQTMPPFTKLTFTNGVAHLPLVVQRPGPFGVGVTGLSFSPGFSGPFVPFRDLPVVPSGAGTGSTPSPCLTLGDNLHPVPVVTTRPGASARCVLTPPDPGYTQVTATSSEPQVVATQPPTNDGHGWGVDFKAGLFPGVSIVTVVWTNPQTGVKQTQYVVLGSGVTVDSAKSLYVDWRDLDDTEDDYADVGYDSIGYAVSEFGSDIRDFGARWRKDLAGVTHVDVRVIESNDPFRPSTEPAKAPAPRPAQPSQPAPAAPPHDDHGGGE